MEFQFTEVEKKWKNRWDSTQLYKVTEDSSKPKYYILDMFPYPSGSGLHVGHPLGYVASDIVSRYKTLQGFNVLHPMGFDAFGLPAEQYAIETGQHPRTTTEKNINYFREQLERMGFCYDWSREVNTCDPKFYKWTQWIFMQLFKCWYNPFANRAEYIADTLIPLLEIEGSKKIFLADKCDKEISSEEWKNLSEAEQQKFLMQFRLAYLDHANVWWCEALGTVLANDEVKDGVSERGGHPVEKIKMRQWFLRITEYAERLLQGLEKVDFSDSMKDMQRNWIGKSEGALVKFTLKSSNETGIEVFTTRPDTIFGATFMVLAPEHELVEKITTDECKTDVEKYIQYVKTRSERDRQSEVKKVTGQFAGAYAINPFTEKQIPVYIAEYVLAGYGTGAIMAVPSNDDRDYAFAEKFGIDIIPVVDQTKYPNATREEKVGVMINSGLLNGMEVKDAIQKILSEIETKKLGKRKINYRMRDAGYSRQRYWGEPFPVYYKNDLPYLLDEKDLPVILPDVESFKPVGAGKSPLASLKSWMEMEDGKVRETDTMPGYAGSSWYFYRYMDVDNSTEFASAEKINYWQDVDLYIGGTEHAVGHLLYSRMWNKFLFDLGLVPKDEPYKKLVNQGMIQGFSAFINRIFCNKANVPDIVKTDLYVSEDLAQGIRNGEINSSQILQIIKDEFGALPKEIEHDDRVNFFPLEIRIPSSCAENNILIEERIKAWREDFLNGIFKKSADGFFYCKVFPEKMSKSKHNVVNPDEVINENGADCFRLYMMFIGPLDAGKPWDSKGITGVQGFLRKLWRLFLDDAGKLKVTDDAA
ncbi:MAG: class I tRNA ligase family protein, partial [Chitinophagales bacterium]